MTSCCDPNGLSGIFDAAQAESDARRYRRKGLARETRAIADLLVERGIRGATVLDVGGGVGDLAIELLRAGAAHATNVDVSPAYEPVARALAAEVGVQDRIERVVCDFARDAETVPLADAVILNKVVCCYPEMPALVAPAARHARRWLVLVFPADRWWIRAGAHVAGLVLFLIRSKFRFFFHDPQAIVALASEAGLRAGVSRRGIFWQLELLERT